MIPSFKNSFNASMNFSSLFCNLFFSQDLQILFDKSKQSSQVNSPHSGQLYPSRILTKLPQIWHFFTCFVWSSFFIIVALPEMFVSSLLPITSPAITFLSPMEKPEDLGALPSCFAPHSGQNFIFRDSSAPQETYFFT